MFIAGACTCDRKYHRRGGTPRRRHTYLLDYPFLRTYNTAIFEDVLCKVDVGWSSPMFYLLDGFLDVGLGGWHGLLSTWIAGAREGAFG